MKKLLFISVFLALELCSKAQIYDTINYQVLWEDQFTGNRSWNRSTFVEQSDDPGFIPRWECKQSEWWPYYVTTDLHEDHQAYQTTHARFGNDNKLHLMVECKSTTSPLECGSSQGYVIPTGACCSCTHNNVFYLPHQSIFYHSGMIETLYDSSWFGYYEIRCKLPVHPGEGTAFWLFGTGPSTYEEIDIFEHSVGDALVTGSLARDFSCGIWYNPDGTNYPPGNNNTGAHNVSKKYMSVLLTNNLMQEHTYAIEWLPNRVTWYFDGQVINEYADAENIPQHLLNLRVTNVVKDDAMNHSTSLPFWHGSAEMVIDYIKVYRLLSDCDTDLVIQNVNGITNYTPGVKSSITITPSNSITIPTNTNHIMRAENFIQCSGEFTIPLGTEVSFMVHSCTDIQTNY